MVDTAADVSGALVMMERNARVADGDETQTRAVMLGEVVDAQVGGCDTADRSPWALARGKGACRRIPLST